MAQSKVLLTCQGAQFLNFSQNITPLAHTNYVVRMSTGLELQVILPVVNAPFRLYYAYNPLRVDTRVAAAKYLRVTCSRQAVRDELHVPNHHRARTLRRTGFASRERLCALPWPLRFR